MKITDFNIRPPEPTLVQRFGGLLRLTHLFPTIMVLLATFILGLVAEKGQPDWGNLARVWLVVASGHSLIGISNDYLDRHKDRITQPYKPIPAGLVSESFVKNLLFFLGFLEILIALTLPLAAALLAFVCTVSGLLYNFSLKNSYLSWVPYVLSFSSFPFFIWAGLGKFEINLLWLYPPALLLLVGINLANSLPDIETDRNLPGTPGLALLLGLEKSLWATRILFLSAPLVCFGLSFFVAANRLIAWPACGLALLIMGTSFAAPGLSKGRAGLNLVWKLTSISAFVVGIGWLAALTL